MVTIDPDATLVDTCGPHKEGSTFTYRGETGLSPLIGVCGETGDVLALRARGGNANPGRDNAGFIRECVAAIPAAVREEKNLWVRVDSAGYQHDVFNTCDALGAAFTVTAPQRSNVRATILALAADGACGARRSTRKPRKGPRSPGRSSRSVTRPRPGGCCA
jgi:hypothetical protein